MEKGRGKIAGQKWVDSAPSTPIVRCWSIFLLWPMSTMVFFLPLTLPFNVMQFSFGPRAHSKADFANHRVVALEPDPSNLSLWRIRRCKSNRLTVMPRPGQTGFVVTVQGPVFSRITFVRPFKDPCKMDRLDWKIRGVIEKM